ncbi:methyltransferase domain-containing protein [bacterium]|nr:methyltransferase domain-containing protein [bacterium]
MAKPESPDHFFDDPTRRYGSFSFNPEIAEVFDDMVSRSVPWYWEIQGMVGDIVEQISPSGTILDLGCSSGTSLLGLMARNLDVSGIGVDNSPALIKKAVEKRERMAPDSALRFDVGDIGTMLEFPESDITLLILVLQFIPVEKRLEILKRIRNSLNPNGVLIWVEKVEATPGWQPMFQSAYYDLKRRQGYTELEIKNKQKALENVLVPLTGAENEALLHEAGFQNIQSFFQWFNFQGWIAAR